MKCKSFLIKRRELSDILTVRLRTVISTEEYNIQRACLSVSVAGVLRVFMVRVAFLEVEREVFIPVETSGYSSVLFLRKTYFLPHLNLF